MGDDLLARRAVHARQGFPVPLRVAASLVYFQRRRDFSARVEQTLIRALDDAALALAQIASIYCENEAGCLLRIPDEPLRGGVFQGGAQTLRCTDGRTLQYLSIRRSDLVRAMAVLVQR